ncbi:IclR family transcriptional regulator [Corynebacterium felinum]|uniref:DNA-binding IclR family transcriptional regulator n=1 Tax=Corynebacterium felinum TaxID=131318 RepID=A0ABU2B6G4_9CORY|nr:IclR family transcriptional regulator [Corynebacterium felinum]MDF5820747.1 IclR family transcriptional regulator [Corynebacterium felinum]MDR7354203.1 DNA-binding IclR family transcriptional regulator [Corynebacterium felinum]WJY96372.1 Transcriptional regulator KdgR [Corynebacterium felinum]
MVIEKAPDLAPAKTTDSRSAVDKAFSLLRCFGEHDANGIGVSELARRAGMSKTTCHRLLATLVANGAVERAGDVYRLGPLCFELTNTIGSLKKEVVGEVLTPYLAALFEQTRQTVHLAFLQGNQVVYVNKLFSIKRIPAPSRIGGSAPAYCTGVGKAILAWDYERTESVIKAGLSPWTEHTITDPEQFREELAQVRIDGVAYDREEITEGLSCVAAPIFGRNNTPIAAMSVSGPTLSFNPELHIPALRRTCKAAGRAAVNFQRAQEQRRKASMKTPA